MQVLALLLFAITSWGVDKMKFKSCKDASFCRRYQGFSNNVPESSRKNLYHIKSATLRFDEAGDLVADVKNANEEKSNLILRLSIYSSGAVRIRIDEKGLEKPRYRIPENDIVLDGSLSKLSEEQVHISREDDIVVLSFNTKARRAAYAGEGAPSVREKIEIVPSSASIRFWVSDRLVQTFNARSLFSFERRRASRGSKCPLGTLHEDAAVVDSGCHPYSVDTEGLWEEGFRGHQDKKPFGPSALGVDVRFEGEIAGVFGLPEHAEKFNLPMTAARDGEPYRFFNLDVFEYELMSPMALYGAIPMLTALHKSDKYRPDSSASGFLWLNPSDTFVQLERVRGGFSSWISGEEKGEVDSTWVSESGILDALFFPGPSPQGVLRQYHSVLGQPYLPPIFGLAKQQCRWNYKDEKDVREVNAKFSSSNIPMDVLWLDIEHTDHKKYFSWHPSYFPNPQRMQEQLWEKNGRRMVTIVDPHIKRDAGYQVYQQLEEHNLLVEKPNWRDTPDTSAVPPPGHLLPEFIPDASAVKPEDWDESSPTPWEPPSIPNPEYVDWKAPYTLDLNSPKETFEGHCWPGTSVYPDFLSPEVRDFWAGRFSYSNYSGSSPTLFTWNDMNEPSVFNGPEVSMPRDAVHLGGHEHREVHNLYGLYFHNATVQGQKMRDPSARPFVLTRSFFVGTHRVGPVWTGDNMANWEHLGASIPMLLSMASSGLSFVGSDVGGFFGHPDKELFIRWHQLGALSFPFYRSHAHIESPRREPWVYDDEALRLVKEASTFRYQILPYLYSAFARYHLYSDPIIRPLWYHFDDPEMFKNNVLEQEMMVGRDLLVKSVNKPLGREDSTEVFLPGRFPFQRWRSLWNLSGQSYEGGKAYPFKLSLERIPAFVREGSILPFKNRVRRAAGHPSWIGDPLTLKVLADERGEASGELYVDDMISSEHEEGKFFFLKLSFSSSTLTGSLVDGEPRFADSLPGQDVERVEFYNLGGKGAKVKDVKELRRVGRGQGETVRSVPFFWDSNRDVLTVKLPEFKLGEPGWRLTLH